MNSPDCFPMRGALLLALFVFLLGGCHKPKGSVLGTPPDGEVRTVLAVQAGETPSNVTLAGVMVEKCPVAGCWFRLRDRTSVIKVDTKSAGFVVVDVPLESTVTVSGKVVTEGDEVVIQATGVRY